MLLGRGTLTTTCHTTPKSVDMPSLEDNSIIMADFDIGDVKAMFTV